MSRSLARQARITRLPDQRVAVNEYLVNDRHLPLRSTSVSLTPYLPTLDPSGRLAFIFNVTHTPLNMYFIERSISAYLSLNIAVMFDFGQY